MAELSLAFVWFVLAFVMGVGIWFIGWAMWEALKGGRRE